MINLAEYSFTVSIQQARYNISDTILGWYGNVVYSRGMKFSVEETDATYNREALWRVKEGPWEGRFISRLDAVVEEGELKGSSLIFNNTSSMMNLREAWRSLKASEPQKSFQKAGFTNSEDLLTDDGQKVFLTWLLHSVHGEQFKKAVVDPMLKEQEKEKK